MASVRICIVRNSGTVGVELEFRVEVGLGDSVGVGVSEFVGSGTVVGVGIGAAS